MSANVETKQYKIKSLIAANPKLWLSDGALRGPKLSENIFAPSEKSAPDPMNRGKISFADLDEQWVVQQLVEVVERCMQGVKPPQSASGGAGGDWKFDTGGAIRGLTLLGKHLGMFSERVEHQVNVHEDALDELA